MSDEHNLAQEARRELLRALEDWLISKSGATLDAAELKLRDKTIAYFKLKRITGKYRFPDR